MQSEALEIIARAMAMTCNDSEIGWEHYTLDAEEVVTALEARGYVIVPSELDSKDMDHWYVADAGIKVIEDYGGEMGDNHTPEMQISTVYKKMVAAISRGDQ